jgi:hypothetical protein
MTMQLYFPGKLETAPCNIVKINLYIILNLSPNALVQLPMLAGCVCSVYQSILHCFPFTLHKSVTTSNLYQEIII